MLLSLSVELAELTFQLGLDAKTTIADIFDSIINNLQCSRISEKLNQLLLEVFTLAVVINLLEVLDSYLHYAMNYPVEIIETLDCCQITILTFGSDLQLD